MSDENQWGPLVADPTRYRTTISGTFYTAKTLGYLPHEANKTGTGRYHEISTGSVYLGAAKAVCEKEVGRENRALYSCELSASGFFDMCEYCEDYPALSGSLMEASGSGGWEPTQAVGRYLHGLGFRGIRYYSRHGKDLVCLMYWDDRHAQSRETFILTDW